MFRQSDDYLGEFDYDSDEACKASDSDDSVVAENVSDGESDDFEAAMDKDVEQTMKWMASHEFESGLSPPRSSTDAACALASNQTIGDEEKVKYYDDIYFSSGSDEEQEANGATANPSSSRRQKPKVPIPSNDELFYDPSMDDDNERWVQDQRRCYYSDMKPPGMKVEHNNTHVQEQGCPSEVEGNLTSKCGSSQLKVASSVKKKEVKQLKPPPLPRSDAVLNCPSCMTLLCLDCQRHDKYKTQYRAMFVLNCVVVQDEVLHYKDLEHKTKSRRRKRKRQKGVEGADAGVASEPPATVESKYNPVRCQECNTEVAVYDKDEIYHFFNVISSHAP
ncbi:E2F-associated phosphoprotein-like [Corticium candelabrum]|uniref:E2F-associated phosphoprotein-like n=1 Tax=Corticium candelabrum TaxID=121492 RepID=UPI002E269B64|nr:E2F-associated phosphoprotein-like [Corticium candelabrum]